VETAYLALQLAILTQYIVIFKNILSLSSYRAFHGFGQAKYAYGGSILGLSQFTLLPQLPPKTLLDFKVEKIDLKIIISLH
jgi:hypothetical protein